MIGKMIRKWKCKRHGHDYILANIETSGLDDLWIYYRCGRCGHTKMIVCPYSREIVELVEHGKHTG